MCLSRCRLLGKWKMSDADPESSHSNEGAFVGFIIFHPRLGRAFSRNFRNEQKQFGITQHKIFGASTQSLLPAKCEYPQPRFSAPLQARCALLCRCQQKRCCCRSVSALIPPDLHRPTHSQPSQAPSVLHETFLLLFLLFSELNTL